MTGQGLLAQVRARGAEVRVAGGKLRVRPRSAVRDLEREIAARADEIAEALEPCNPTASVDPIEPAHASRVVVESRSPVPGPVRLRPGVTAVDVPRAIDGLLLDLAGACRRLDEARSDDQRRGTDECRERIGELIADLAKLGCRVRVVEPLIADERGRARR